MEYFVFNIDLHYWPAAVLSFIPALLNVSFFVYILFCISKSEIKSSFLVFIFFLIIWQMRDTLVRLSADPETALFWVKNLLFAPLLMIPSALYFVLRFIGRGQLKNPGYLMLILFVPALFFIAADYTGVVTYTLIPDPLWRWLIVTDKNLLITCESTWCGMLSLLILVILFRENLLLKKRNKVQRQKQLLITAGFTIPTLQGILTEIMFPYMLDRNPIPVTSSVVTVFSVCILVAFLRYRLFEYTPLRAWLRIINNLNEGILIVNQQDEIQYSNNRFCDMTGYRNNELEGNVMNEFLIDDRDKKFFTKVLSSRNDAIAEKFEIRLKNNKGISVWCEANEIPYMNNSGKVVGHIGIYTDKSTIRQSEFELRESKNKLAEIIQTINGIVYEANAETLSIEYISPQVEKILGYRAHECLNGNLFWKKTIYKEDQEWVFKACVEKIGTGEDHQFDYRMVAFDGRIVWVRDIASVVVKNGHPQKIRGILVDITEQKIIQDALEQMEERSRLFIDQSLSYIIMYDPGSKKLSYANRSFIRSMGYNPEEITGLSIYDIAYAVRENVDFHHLRVLRDKSNNLGERKWKKKDGALMDVMVNTVLITQKQDVMICVIASDITERKQLEEKLQEKVAEMNMFVYRASHDLRGPIASIKGLCDLAQKESSLANLPVYFEQIEKSISRLDGIFTDLANVVKIAQSKMEITELWLRNEIQDILESLKFLAHFNETDIVVDVPPEIKLHCDKTILILILQNLIINSLKYRDPGKQQSFIRIVATDTGENTEVQVIDNAQGIPEEIQARVFDMFFRGNETSQGTGLGLYMVKNAMERLGGKISFKSKAGEGTTFFLQFPNDKIAMQIS